MANYVTGTSDKSKKKAMRMLLCGGLGFHMFYVGRIKAGFFYLFLGLLFWSLLIDGIVERHIAMILSGILCLILLNIFDFIKLKLGKFKDNIGNYLRA